MNKVLNEQKSGEMDAMRRRKTNSERKWAKRMERDEKVRSVRRLRRN